jgi:hypothetical protein
VASLGYWALIGEGKENPDGTITMTFDISSVNRETIKVVKNDSE